MADPGPTQQPTGAHPGRREVISLALTAALMAYLLIALLGMRSRPDVDLWLHLRIGEFLRQGGHFGPGPDPFVALADQPYVPSQWLADVLGAWTYGAGGLVAVEWLRLGCVLSLAALLVAACRLRGGAVPAAAAALTGTVATSAGWGERPQLLGFVFLALTSVAWWRSWQSGRPPWLLIPLTWVWACVHGSWVTGVGLGAAMVVAIALDRPPLRDRLPRMAAVPVLSVVAAAVTPLGPRLLLNPLQVSSALTGKVNEWQHPSAGNVLMWLVVLAAVVAAVGLQRTGRLGLGRLALCLGAIVLAVWMVRLVAVGAIVVAPVLAEALSRGTTLATKPPRVTRAEGLLWTVAVLAVLVGGGILAAQPRPVPVAPAVSAAMGAAPSHTHVMAAPQLSGWLLWTHPDLIPLRDLRSEIYSPAVGAAYESAYAAKPGWQAYLTAHDVRLVVVETRSPLSRALAANPAWVQRIHDTDYVVWQRIQPAGS